MREKIKNVEKLHQITLIYQLITYLKPEKMYTIFHTIRKATPLLIRQDCQRKFRVATGFCGKRLAD